MIARFSTSTLRRILLLALPLALGLFFLFPASSLAHAILLRSDPVGDSILTSAPSEIHMWFSENLNPSTSKAVILKTNRYLANTSYIVSSSNTKEMDLTIRDALPPGVYLVIWRTQSADDGQVLSGSLPFKIANPDGTVPKQTINPIATNALLGDTSSNQFDGNTLLNAIMITLVDLGLVFWVGAQLWQNFVLQSGANEAEPDTDQQAEQRFQQKFSLLTLFVILLANVGILIGQGLGVSNGNFAQALSLNSFHDLIAVGQFGTYWKMREIVVFLAILVAAYIIFRPRRPNLINVLLPSLNLLLGLVMLIAVLLSGQATTVTNTSLVYAILIDWLHLLAASLWIGGTIYLSLIYLPLLKSYSPLERTQSMLSILPRFSPLAITGIIIIAITGPFNTTFHMDSLNQLFGTAYGRTLLIKSLLACVMLVISAIHIGLFRPRLAKDYKIYVELAQQGENADETKRIKHSIVGQTNRLNSTLRWELLLGIAVLLCTGLLTVFAGTLTPEVVAPSPNQQAVPSVKAYSTTLKTSDNVFTVKLNVSPNRFGPNVFTVTALDSSGKVQSNIGVSIYTTMLDMEMGTDSINLQPDGKGNFSATENLDMGGNWQFRIQIRTPDKKLHEVKLKIVTSY